MTCWEPGDIAIVRFGHAHNSIPGLAGGLVGIGAGGSQAAGPMGMRAGYRVLLNGDGSGAFGSFTSAGGGNSWTVAIYRGQHATTPMGKLGGSGGSGATVTYPALTAPLNGSFSWVLGMGHRQANVGMTAPPGAMVNRIAIAASISQGFHDTGATVASWASTAVTYGTGGAWQSNVFELRGAASGSLQFIYAYGGTGVSPTLIAQCAHGQPFEYQFLG